MEQQYTYRENADVIKVITPVGKRPEFPLKPSWMKTRHFVVAASLVSSLGLTTVVIKAWPEAAPVTSAVEIDRATESPPPLPVTWNIDELQKDPRFAELLQRVTQEEVQRQLALTPRQDEPEAANTSAVPAPAMEAVPPTSSPPKVTQSPPTPSAVKERQPRTPSRVTRNQPAPKPQVQTNTRRTKPKQVTREMLGLSERDWKCLQSPKLCQ